MCESWLFCILQGREDCGLRLRFTCSRGLVYKPQKKVSPSKQRTTSTKKPTQLHKTCRFSFSVKWDLEQVCWTMKGGLGCRYHNDHVHVKEEEVFVCAKFLPDAEKEIARDSFAIHNPAGSVGALLQKRTGRILTPAQLEYFRICQVQMKPSHLLSI